jgi:phenylalanyl-tRNA synthetase beta subunit
MKNSEMKAVAEALSRAQDCIESICEVMLDDGTKVWDNTEIYIQIPRVRDSTYKKISEMCGIQIDTASNNHVKEKKIVFRIDAEGKRKEFCLEVAFEFLCKLIPWCDLKISHA